MKQITVTEYDLGASYRYVGYDERHSLQLPQYNFVLVEANSVSYL